MGNELFFEGKKYISSRRASQITGYNSDYIGQLCRKGSLECRLVGRSWFVEEKSLSEHRVVASKTPRGRIPICASGKESGLKTISDSNTDLGVVPPAHHPYDHSPFIATESQKSENALFVKKIVGVCVVIILCVLSAPFLISGVHDDKINVAVLAGSKIAREINLNASEHFASVVGSIKNVGLSLSLDSDKISELRIKTHKLTLRTYHTLSILPDLFFDTARNMKKIVMRTNESAPETLPRGENVTRAGITVVPSSGDPAKDEKLKQYIKDSFSDETNVAPDETGISGVIKPIFKKQNDQDYLYVIVPVKE